DDPTAADIMARLLEEMGFEVHSVETGEEGSQVASQVSPELVVIDERLPDTSGTTLARSIRASLPKSTIAMCTVVDEDAMIQRAFGSGCNYYVVKPNGFLKLCNSRPTPERLLDSAARELLLGR